MSLRVICRTNKFYAYFVSSFALLTLSGCASLLLNSTTEPAEKLEQLTEETATPYISKYAHPYGLSYEKIESVGLVTGLDGTGEDPAPTPQRAAMLDDMSRRKVPKPNQVLASMDTALVLVRAYLKPGIRKGDRFDVEVRTPTRSKAESLRGGWVLESRLTQLAALGGQIREGHTLALAEGPVLVDPSADDSGDTAAATTGRILGGGVALKDRHLGIVVSSEYSSVRMSTSIAKAINERFHRYEAGQKMGVAEAKTDERIELRVHDRYRDHITRYVRVIRNIPLRETPAERQDRLVLLGNQLLDPLMAAKAALRLEAIGDDQAIERLLEGIKSDDAEVRFYSAEALAYLDETSGVKALAEAARDEPAFRAHALAALSAMDDVVAYDSLRNLLSSKSAETRYGAFRALRAMNEKDPMIRGERLGGHFSYHVLDVEGPEMIHATISGRPELVLYGTEQRFELPLVLDAGRDILVNGLTGDEVVVSKFTPGDASQKRTVSNKVDEVIRAIVELGGNYPDVVQAIQEARKDGALASRFRVDAIPTSGREYGRDDPLRNENDEESEPESRDSYHVSAPMPDLFSTKHTE